MVKLHRTVEKSLCIVELYAVDSLAYVESWLRRGLSVTNVQQVLPFLDCSIDFCDYSNTISSHC